MQLFRLQKVSTLRRDRINSDEEERQRLGYGLRTGELSVRNAVLQSDGKKLATRAHGNASTLWLMNLG